MNTYEHEFEATALHRFEQIDDPGFQTSADVDACAEVVEQDSSEDIGIT